MQLTLNMSSYYPSLMSWLRTPAAFREYLLWMASQGTTRLRCTQKTSHTSFQTTLGVYCYTVIPFKLKNAAATYQRAMSTIFHSHLRKIVECYVDDIAVKSRDKNDHLRDLKIMFDIMRAYQLKMNPTKSFLDVSSGKFLGFIVTSKGIHLDPDKEKLFRVCNHLRILKNSGICKVGWPISEDSLQIS